MKAIGVTILGGSGYGAGELLRYLSFHPAAEVIEVVSSSNAGELVETLHPHLTGFYPELRCVNVASFPGDFTRRVLFSSLPHGKSSEELARLIQKGLPARTHCIDLSGDLRLQNEEEHKRHYADVPFQREFRSQFCYLLPELFFGTPLVCEHVSNPGCLAAAGALATAPLADLGVEGAVVIDAKTGTSGAGRSPQESMHHPHRHGNFEAYKILAHRHEPEIRQAAKLTETMFVPHLLPVSRGIFVTAYATLKTARTKEDLQAAYRQKYHGSPFIRMRERSPALHEVVGTNFCDIAIEVRGRQVAVMAALDNLGKGMAGTAIQNMNLLCGLEHDLGLKVPALGVQ